MRILTSIEDFAPSEKQVVLTIGNFDGVHLGHQAILKRLSEEKGEAVVLTFSNHPSEVLASYPSQRLITPSHKLHLLHKFGINTTLLLPFTEEFSRQSAETFLTHLRNKLPFSQLILGYDAVIGHNREGNYEVVSALANKMGFKLEYIDPVKVEKTSISSRFIRSLIQSGHFAKVERFLGRPYSILDSILPGSGLGKILGLPTLTLSLEGLCLPPFGVYTAWLCHGKEKLPAIVNIGMAPTVGNNQVPHLDAYCLQTALAIEEEEIEVIPLHFLRPEQTFSSLDALKKQINDDIVEANLYFKQISVASA